MSRRSTLRAGTSRINVRPSRTEVSESPRLVSLPEHAVATLPDILRQLPFKGKDQLGLSNEEIDMLLNARYVNEEKTRILHLGAERDPKDIANAHSIMGLLVKSGFDVTLAYLNSVSTDTDIPFEVPTLRFAADRLKAEIRALREEIVVSSGLYPCRKCHSKNTIDVQRQTRAGDEALTTFVTCLEKACRYHFKVVATTAVAK